MFHLHNTNQLSYTYTPVQIADIWHSHQLSQPEATNRKMQVLIKSGIFSLFQLIQTLRPI